MPQPRLLDDQDRPAVEVANPDGAAPLVVVCDHASNAVPRRLGGLGLPPEDMIRHIAWDIGAAAVSRILAECLGGPAVLAGYSRLVVDLNRQPGDPSSIPAVSDGTAIPGNAEPDEDAIARRLEAIFWPYHHCVTETIGRQWRRSGRPPAVIAVHSFTPVMGGFERPWHVGVLWNHDPRMALPLIERLGRLDGVVVGDNEPYSGRAIGYTVDRHAGAAGLPHVGIELRQDLIDDAAGATQWAAMLAAGLRDVLALPAVHRVEIF